MRVGTELDRVAEIAVADRAAGRLGFGQFWAGGFVDAANGAASDGDARFGSVQFTVRF